MAETITIIGAGGLGREVLGLARACQARDGDLRIKGFIDNDPHALDGFDVGVPIIGGDQYVASDDDSFVIAVGDPNRRAELSRLYRSRGRGLTTLVHPLACVTDSATLQPGCVICAFAFVAENAVIGESTFLNTYASVGHDSIVGSGSVLSPYAVVNGNAEIAESVLMGTHATVLSGRKVGPKARIAAGSVVYRNVGASCMAIGNPAKISPLSKTA